MDLHLINNRLRRFLPIGTTVISFNCSDEDIVPSIPMIHEYHPLSMFYPSLFPPDTTKIKIIYGKRNEIVQRIGAVIRTGIGFTTYEHIADTVKYYGDSIVITKQLLSEKDFSNMLEYKRKLILKNGLIVQEIFGRDFYGDRNNDTLSFKYNDQKQIIEVTQIQSGLYTKYHKYHYDSKGNLNTITAERFRKDVLTDRDTTWFLDYDSSPNPVKNLVIFQECFYRSLSTNTFTKYIHKSYSMIHATKSNFWREWDFEYDENNYPIF